MYAARLDGLLASNLSADEFHDALRDQSWVVPAIRESASNPAIKSMADQLNALISSPGGKGANADTVRRIAQLLAQECYREKAEVGNTESEVSILTRLSTWAALVSTVVAILLGRDGLLSFLGVKPQANNANPGNGAPAIPLLPDSSEISICLMNVIILIVLLSLFLAFRSGHMEIKEPETVVSKKSYKQFRSGWIAVLLTWLLLYVWLGLTALSPNAQLRQNARFIAAVWGVADLFNSLNGASFFWCFLVMDMPSVPSEQPSSQPRRDRTFWLHVRFIWVLGLILFVLSLLGRSSLVPPLVMSGPMLCACYTGLGMAYFVGRLDSHHMFVPRYLLAPLYLYVLIQLPWAGFGGPGPAEPLRRYLLGLSLVLKTYFCMLLSMYFLTGTFSEYFAQAERYYRPTTLTRPSP